MRVLIRVLTDSTQWNKAERCATAPSTSALTCKMESVIACVLFEAGEMGIRVRGGACGLT